MAEMIPVVPLPVSALTEHQAASSQGTAHNDTHQCPCESVWTCVRGRTHLRCELQGVTDGRCQLTLLRNSRTYGRYEFDGRDAALTFATRLRFTFEGNGWNHC